MRKSISRSVSGYVVDVRRTKGADGRTRAVEPGAAVTTGLVLARIRAIDYQTVVDGRSGARDESGAGVDAAEAALAEAHAAFTQAESDFGRIATLWQQESVTKPARREQSATGRCASQGGRRRRRVAAASQRAAAAAAQLREARIALGDTELRAPFDAIVLERRVDVEALSRRARRRSRSRTCTSSKRVSAFQTPHFTCFAPASSCP